MKNMCMTRPPLLQLFSLVCSGLILLMQPMSDASASTVAFEYPRDNQVLDHGGSYMAKVRSVPGASYYYVHMSQKIPQPNGKTSYISEGGFGQNFGLHPSDPKHQQFQPNVPTTLQSWAYINSNWVRLGSINVSLKATAVASGPLFKMNVLSISFLKTDPSNPANWDQSRRGGGHEPSSLVGMRRHIDESEDITMRSLERGSKSINGSGVQSLEYNIVNYIEFNQFPPNGQIRGNSFNPAYDQILNQMVPASLGISDFCSYIDSHDIQEVWIWTDHDSVTVPIESQMSSPRGKPYLDIANSTGGEDRLPHCGHTYIMYNYNFTRGPNEALHNHLHQIENVLGYHDNNSEQDKELFDWEGSVSDPSDRTNEYGHLLNTGSWSNSCGDSHWSANIARDPGGSNPAEYIWDSNRVVYSDCSDWNPQGTGFLERIDCSAWGCNELGFYVWWMQRIPGDANGLLSNNGLPLRNWWETFARYDRVVTGNSVLVDYSNSQ